MNTASGRKKPVSPSGVLADKSGQGGTGQAAHRLLDFGRQILAAAPRLTMAAVVGMVCCIVLELAALLLLTPLLAQAHNDGAAARAPLAGLFDPIAARLGFDGLLCGYVVVLGLLSVVLQYSGIVHRRIAYAFVGRLRCDLLAGLLRARWTFVSGLKSAEVTHALTTATVYLVIGAQQFWQLLSGCLVIAVYTAVCAAWSPQITLLAGLGLALPLWLGAMRRDASGAVRRRYAEAGLAYDATVADSLAAVRWAKTHGLTARVFGELKQTLDVYADVDLALLRHASANRTMQAAWGALMMGLTLYLALIRLHLPLAQIVVLLFVFFRLWPRVGSLMTTYHQIDHALPFLEQTLRLTQTIEAAAEAGSDSGGERMALRGAIELRDVSFRYGPQVDGRSPVLDRLNARIDAGAITALIGPSGTGKSTLLDLVAGLLQPTSGQVLIDGRRLSPDLLAAWRNSIACVGTDSPLFHTSLRENLCMGAPGASDAELWQALDFAAAGDFVTRLPDALDTLIGDRGAMLSGGERQRICLARAVLQRPALLILDEATNALDAETEARIFSRLRAWRGDRTVLIVSHRPTVRALADHVLELRCGNLVSLDRGGSGAPGAILKPAAMEQEEAIR
ncbi:MAG: multidrug transporter [Nevskia sp.]|nr:multidrug transporter [Nevskia sp.]